MRTLIFIGILLVAGNLFACDKRQLAPSEALAEADVVFRGVVDNLFYLDHPEKSEIEPRIVVTFKVSEVWKGTADKIVTIHTTHNKSTCNGYVFKAGEEYLVYSRYNRRADNFLAKLFAPETPTLGIKIYGGTKPISNAAEDVKVLGKGMSFDK